MPETIRLAKKKKLVQTPGEKIISEISGSYSNVVGLPVEKLREELTAWSHD